MYLFLASSVNFVAKDISEKITTITKNKRLIFIPTASEVEKGDLSWLDMDRKALEDAGFSVEDYSITGQKQETIQKKLEGAGSVCVSGGNTYYLLSQTRKSGFDVVVRRLVKNGLIFIGSSAGSLLAGPNIETSLDDPTTVPELTDYRGLHLIDVAIRTHWGSKYFLERYHQEMDRLYSLKQKMILLRDNQYLYVKDNWYQVISVTEK